MKIIKSSKTKLTITEKKQPGYMVSFEVKHGAILSSDHFPDKHAGEPLIRTEEHAWKLAQQFADSTDESYVNIYVIDSSFNPVPGYIKKMIRRNY